MTNHTQGEWTDIQQKVEQALTGIPTYWGRPHRTPKATQHCNQIANGQQPPPSGWKP